MPEKMPPHELIILQTKTWLKSIIVANNFCPFARSEFERGSIHYRVVSSSNKTEGLQSLMLECERLDSDQTIETTLLIYTGGYDDFNDYLGLLELAEDLLIEQGYEGIYQLASFHPAYIFANVNANDAANYTNRSPYPILHLIREQSIEKVLNSYPNPENIPQRNVDLARRLGVAKMKELLDSCYISKS